MGGAPDALAGAGRSPFSGTRGDTAGLVERLPSAPHARNLLLSAEEYAEQRTARGSGKRALRRRSRQGDAARSVWSRGAAAGFDLDKNRAGEDSRRFGPY